MWNTFKYTVLSSIRERSVLIWALLFPLVLATLFSIMFVGLDEASSFSPIPVAVVDDANFQENESFSQMIDILAEKGENQTLIPFFVPGVSEAEDLARQGLIDGYYLIDSEGEVQVFVRSSNDINLTGNINQTILKTIADNYLRTRTAVETMVEENPLALANETMLDSLFTLESFTKEITVVANTASASVRYFYALLGFATIMAANIAMIAITRTQANLSSIGARRSLGGTGRVKTLAATLLASWMLSFLCLVIAFSYMRFVLDISFGGRDLACIFGLLVASLMSTALGAAVGGIPKMGESAKAGVLTGLTCFLALFAGLYGDSSQELADNLARDIPWLQAINPVKQVADLFYSLYYYDTFDQFFSTVFTVLAIALVLFVIASILMRRQRYASI